MKEFNFESTINYYSDDPYIFQPSALYDIKQTKELNLTDYNIYFIAKTNRFWFQPGSFFVDKVNNIATGKYVSMEQYVGYVSPFSILIPDEGHSVEVSPFPHKELILKDINNNIIRNLHIHRLSLSSLPDEIKPLFEVLYIGRSYGRKNKLNITDRLYTQNHKSFKNILFDINENEPDKEIFILTLNFKHSKNILSTGFNWIDTPFSKERERIEYFRNLDISRNMQIDIIEEILINYFKPQYNNLLKHSISNLNTKTAQSYKNMDVSGLVIEFTTKETGIRLFSESVVPKKLHMIKIPILKDKDRQHVLNESDIQTSRNENIDYLIETI